MKKGKRTRLKYEIVEGWKALSKLSDGTPLAWVPGWEGVLQYAPEDIAADRCLRLWHVFMHDGKRRRARVCENIRPAIHSKGCQRPRLTFLVKHKGKRYRLDRAPITMRCMTGFAIADPRHWVVDHIRKYSTLDDRPSNLQVIPQKENLARSEDFKTVLVLNNQQRHEKAELYREWYRYMVMCFMAQEPGCTQNQARIELQQWMDERTDEEIATHMAAYHNKMMSSCHKGN